MRPELAKLLGAALAAVEPGQAVRRAMRLERDAGALGGDSGLSAASASPTVLRVGTQRHPLDSIRRVVVVGAGKASAPMAAAVEDVLGDALPIEGSVTVRYDHSAPTRAIRIREAGHPVPDTAGIEATRAIVDLVNGADAGDLVICVLSGGGSALLTLPVDDISLDDLRSTTDALLRSGASINEINVVRKHLDRVKGGGLARLAAPAQVITLVLSDVVGNPLDAIASGPTVPDTSTFNDAAAVFDRYDLWDRVPLAVSTRLRAGLAGAVADTPKQDNTVFERTQTVVVGSNLVACEAAAAAAETMGFSSLVLSTFVEGEAREVGRVLAGILREVDASGHPLKRPCLVVAGGETTVTVRGAGRGGRNQELALAAAFALRGVDNVLLASIGTDGSDGPTDAAGAYADGSTIDRALAGGIDPARHLAENDSYTFFEALGDLIRTGPTQTNVNDIYFLLAF